MNINELAFYLLLGVICLLDFCLFSVRDAEASFSMPELTYNLNLLIDMAETDIIQTDRQ